MNKPLNIERRFPAKIEKSREITALAVEAAQAAGFPSDVVFKMRLAVDEACTNIIQHAYRGPAVGDIKINIHAVEGMLRIALTDFGEAYDPSIVRSQPLNAARLEEAVPGGLGLYLMRQVMDEVQYHSEQNANTLVMVKRHA